MEIKPLRETKVGQWLAAHAPQVLEVAGDFIPAPFKGAMTFVKNMVKAIPGISPETITEFDALSEQHEVEIIKLYNEEISNARSREIELAKITGTKDKLMWALSLAGILIPVLLLGYLIYTGKPVDPLVAGFVGVIVGSYMVVFNYHFGSSSGSAKKQETIDSMMKPV